MENNLTLYTLLHQVTFICRKRSLWLHRLHLRGYHLHSIPSFMFPGYYLSFDWSVSEKRGNSYYLLGPIRWQLRKFLAMFVLLVSFVYLILGSINRKRDRRYDNLPSSSCVVSSSAFTDEVGRTSSSSLWWCPSKAVTVLSISVGTFRLLSAINVCHLIRLSARDHIRLSKVSSKASVSDNGRK